MTDHSPLSAATNGTATTIIRTTKLSMEGVLLRHSIPVELWPIVISYMQKSLTAGKGVIHPAVDLWFSNLQQALLLYGSMSYWDTSEVTDMYAVFSKQRNPYFGGERGDTIPNLEHWDTRSVINMSDMFYCCKLLNNNHTQDISHWNVSNVKTMTSMFYGCEYFNQPLQFWNVSQVTNMSEMFAHTHSFNQSLANWNVEKVVNMFGMFANTKKFNQSVEDWNMPNVNNVSYMFHDSFAFNQPLHTWKLSQPHIRIHSFLRGNKVYNQPLPINSPLGMGKFAKKESLSSAVHLWFSERQTCLAFYGDISHWDVSEVTDMSELFANRRDFNVSLSNWDVSRVTSMKGMFCGALKFNQPLDTWDVRNVTDMSGMFNWATSFNQSLKTWQLGGVKDMRKMFCVTTSFKQTMRIEMIDACEDKQEVVRILTCNDAQVENDDSVVVWKVNADCLVKDVFLGCGGSAIN